MYQRQDFTEYSGAGLERLLRSLTEQNHCVVNFTVSLADLPQDCTIVEFLPGNAIKFHVPTQFASAERLNFFTNRWLCTWQMFALAKERYADVTGQCPLWLDDFPRGSGLAFCGNAVGHILVPDSSFLETGGYAELRTSLAERWTAWELRQDKVFWRGASTGDRSLLQVQRWQDIPRIRLCLLAKRFDRDDILDVALSSIVQVWDASELDEITKADIIRNKVSQQTFMNYRYSIDIDGNTCSWPGLFTKLLMGNTVIKVASAGGHRQWYYDRLMPWKNFVPISSAMKELLDVAQWLIAHPDETMKIAAGGRELAESLTMDAVLNDAAIIIRDCLSHWPSHGRWERVTEAAAAAKMTTATTKAATPATAKESLMPEYSEAHVAIPSTEHWPPATTMSDSMTEVPLARQLNELVHGTNVYTGFVPTFAEDLQGWNSTHPIFGDLISASAGRILIDVGVWKGSSTIFLAELLKQRGTAGAVIAVDTFLGSPEHWNQSGDMFHLIARRYGRPLLYEQFMSNVVRRELEDWVVPLPQTSISAAIILKRCGILADVIQIDASHEYEAVLNDARAYWELLRPGGFLVGDDYHGSWPGVVKAADEFAAEVKVELQLALPKWIMRKPS